VTERPTGGRATEAAQDSTRTALTADDTVTEQPRKPKQPTSAVEEPETVTDSTVSAQGEVRSATTDTTAPDGVAAKDRDDAAQANTGDEDVARSKPHASPGHKDDTDNATQKDNAPQKDSVTNEKP
jgi:hypothetical protein